VLAEHRREEVKEAEIERDRARARWVRAVQGPSDVAGLQTQRNRACRARPEQTPAQTRWTREGETRPRVVYYHNMYKHDVTTATPKRDVQDLPVTVPTVSRTAGTGALRR
jgi:hypothetical protein